MPAQTSREENAPKGSLRAHDHPTKQPRTLVAIATYNEIENLPKLVDEIFLRVPEVDILVIDDNSPDGTGRWCEQQAQLDRRLHCLHRQTKAGLGTATVAGLRFAIDGNYEYVVTMDADFSHAPKHIPELLSCMQGDAEHRVDVAIGSRYVHGGGCQGWPWYRRLMSRVINRYARSILRLPVADCSGAFRCYRTAVLSRLGLDRVSSKGYAYLEEILWLLAAEGAGFTEIPITFVDRQLGQTKINWREAVVAVVAILRMGLRRRP